MKTIIAALVVTMFALYSCTDIYTEGEKRGMKQGDTIYINVLGELTFATVQKNDTDNRVLTVKRKTLFGNSDYIEVLKYNNLP